MSFMYFTTEMVVEQSYGIVVVVIYLCVIALLLRTIFRVRHNLRSLVRVSHPSAGFIAHMGSSH